MEAKHQTHLEARRWLKLATVWLALITGGCSSSSAVLYTLPDLPEMFPNHASDTIVSNVSGMSSSITSMTSKSRIRYQAPDKSGSVNLNIAHRKSDSLYASIRVTLGIEAARALITPDSFFVYHRIKKKLYLGPVDLVNAIIPTPAPYGELFSSIAGTLVPDSNALWLVTSDSSYYYLTDADGTRSYQIDPRIWRVVRLDIFGEGGDLVERRTFSQFDLFGTTIMPRRIEVVRPQDGHTVSVYHKSIVVNPENLKLEFVTGRISERILVRRRNP